MSGLNRVLVVLAGLAAFLLGAVTLVLGSAFLGGLVATQLPGLVLPGRTDPLLPSGALTSLTTTGAALLVLLGAVVVAVLAVGWLLGQLPARRATRPLRLSAGELPGTVTLDPEALADVVEAQLLTRSGVTSARVEVRGAAVQPRLVVKISVEENADVPGILAFAHGPVVDGVGTALQVPLDRFALQVDLVPVGRSAGSARLDATAALRPAPGPEPLPASQDPSASPASVATPTRAPSLAP